MLYSRRLLVAAVVAALTMTVAVAAPPPGKGPGSGGGGGGGGGTSKDVYSEMVQIDRDVNGVPIMTWALGPKDKWGWVPSPIMFGDKDDCGLEFDKLDDVAPNSIYTILGIKAKYIPFVDGEIPEADAPCMTEARLGRLSVARAPKFVADRGLYEFVATLSMGEVSLDPAGRLVVTYSVENEEGDQTDESYAIDAPLQNLGGFRGILTTGGLSHPDVNDGAPVTLPVHPGHVGPDGPAVNLFDRAAAMLGAASDKFGYVGLDEVVYMTQILGITSAMTDSARNLFGYPWPAPYGNPVTAPYFNFSKFEYDRSETYAGDLCYLKNLKVDGTAVTAEIAEEPIMELVFNDAEFTGSNVWGFKQAVDDARAVIYWVHENPMPAELLQYCGDNYRVPGGIGTPDHIPSRNNARY